MEQGAPAHRWLMPHSPAAISRQPSCRRNAYPAPGSGQRYCFRGSCRATHSASQPARQAECDLQGLPVLCAMISTKLKLLVQALLR